VIATGTINAAIDHRLRYAFSDTRTLPDTVERGIVGACLLAGPAIGAALRRAGHDLASLIDELIDTEQPECRARPLVLPAPAERGSPACAMRWRGLRRCTGTRRLWPGTPLGDAGPGLTVDDLLRAVPGYAVDDLMAQAELTAPTLGKARAACPPSKVHAGPDFAGSPDVEGADADLIVGDLLLDIKELLCRHGCASSSPTSSWPTPC
jgi:hypothetical protein